MPKFTKILWKNNLLIVENEGNESLSRTAGVTEAFRSEPWTELTT